MIICIIIIIVLLIVLAYIVTRNKHLQAQVNLLQRENEVFVDEYLALVKIDVRNDTYENIKVDKKVESLLQETNVQANFQLKRVMAAMVANGAVDELLDFCEIKTVSERLEKRKRIHYDFRGKMNGWCRAGFTWIDKNSQIVLYSVKQIEDDKMKENQLKYMTENDLLTGLHNEKYGIGLLNAQLNKKKSGMFCLIEVDDFKNLNDTYGSVIGDKIIVEVANSMKESFKDQDILFRRGGARFAVFSTDVQDKQDGRFLMKMFENQIKVLDIEDIRVSVSSGVAFYRSEEITYEELLARAESCIATSREIDGVSVSYYD